jgi:AmmeMemoRadiSam system protein B
VPAEPPESERSKKPGRIILPGSFDEPEPAEEPAQPERSEPEAPQEPGGSRIILPPGSSVERDDDLPEYPRLRPLEIVPARSGQQELLLISDPLGVLGDPVALRVEAFGLLQLLDGTLSINEISALVARESKDVRAARFVRDLIAQFDKLLLLDSPRFHQAYDALRDEYHRLEIRQAAHEGGSYPANPDEARAFLDEHFKRAAEMSPAPQSKPGMPRALLMPHLDPRRAGAAIARGWLELDAEDPTPLRVIVYGVGHSLFGEMLALTRKHFETPFGRVDCDMRFVDALAERLGDDAAYAGEMAHREEHSIEFQALYLKYRFPRRRVEMVPILCGGFHALMDLGKTPKDVPVLEALIEAVRETERELGGTTLHLASVDLSHVGVRFGDPAPDERVLKEVDEKDHAAIEAARRGDAEGWYQSIAAHQDSSRVCGWGATYVMLRSSEPHEGRLLHYEASREDGGSLVSVATLAWP